MAYRLKTFRVQFVAESLGYPTGSPCRASEDADRIARSIYGTLDADKEHFLLLTLNNKNRVNGFKVVSTGSLTASLVHPRLAGRPSPLRGCCYLRPQPSKRRPCAKPGRPRNHASAQGNGRHARDTGLRSHSARTRTVLLVQRQRATIAVLPLP